MNQRINEPFVVLFGTRVDHPELRGETYPVVPRNHRFLTAWHYLTQGAAVRVAEALMHHGECDFSSEYVCSVQVLRMYEGKSPRRVRVLRRRYSRTGAWQRDG